MISKYAKAGLTMSISAPSFSSSKLSEYKYKNLFKQIVQRVDNPFVENLFNQLLSELNLQSSAWEDALTSPMLPALALIPGVGMSIVIDIDVNGVYKTIGENGTNEYQSFPDNTIFRMLKFQAKESIVSSAKAMFESIAKKQKKYFL